MIEPRPSSSYIRPYGDTPDDGMIQVSFTLPVTHGPKAEGAALRLVAQMGMRGAMVAHSRPIGDGFSFFVVYGALEHVVDLDEVEVPEREYPVLAPTQVNARIKEALRRKLVVVGACVGSDAHTVGIDAILNIKGFAGEKGLEYYRELRVINLGAQVAVADLVARARAEGADAVLVSQVVTQRDAHLHNVRAFAAAFLETMGSECPVLIAGGPRFDPSMAAELGIDRVFGKGTTPGEVASYLVHRISATREGR